MIEITDALINICGRENVHLNEPMMKHTSFRIGGPADWLVSPGNAEALCGTINFLKNESIPYFILGNGSNLLVSDDGYRGVVIQIGGDGVVARAQQPVERDVERLRDVEREHDVVGPRAAEQARQLDARAVDRVRGVHRARVRAARAVAQRLQGLQHRLGDLRGLLQRGCGVVQIDHGISSPDDTDA